MRGSFFAATLLALTIGGVGCSSSSADDSPSDQGGALSDKDHFAKWIYNGPLPALEPLPDSGKVQMINSMSAHTLRVSGLLPAGFDQSKIPFYARAEQVGDRTKITVMYPIASGAPGDPHPNADFTSVFIDPHHTTDAHYGGFPFVGYTGLIGFHGPITGDKTDWILNRGMVSNGCNRMVAEHVVELTHILGTDMSQPRGSAAGDRPQWPHKTVDLRVHPVPDVVNGTAYDVDYPVTANTGVKLPTVGGDITTIEKFPTWSSDDFPTSVCEYKQGTATPLPSDYCKYAGPNKKDLYAPFALVTTPTQTRPFQGKIVE
jgi:hypothetical protein